MSKYTTQVRRICESYANLNEGSTYPDVLQIIDIVEGQIFSNYPIYDESYRKVLNSKILEHYWMREIAHETVGLWKLRLNTKMRQIMPYYNMLYKSAVFDFNPLYNVDYTINRKGDTFGSNTQSSNEINERTGVTNKTDVNILKRENERRSESNRVGNYSSENDTETTNTNSRNGVSHESTTGSETGTNTIKNIKKYSDTPQNGIEGLDEDETLTDLTIDDNTNTTANTSNKDTNMSENTNENGYASSKNVMSENSATNEGVHEKDTDEVEGNNTENVNKNDKEKITKTGDGVTNNHERYIERVVGKMGGDNYARLIKEYRETLLNIDMMIIDELEPLFFGLW